MEDRKTPYPVTFLVPVFLFAMVAIPAALAVAPIFLVNSTWARIAFAAISPVIFSLVHVLITGVLSYPFQKAIVPGKFPRRVSHFVYGPRRMYGLAWGAIFYCTPVYYAFMSVPQLRTFMLRLFGYRGHADVTIAPDAWIRDLPCLRFGQGTYTANKCTIGTNMCLSDGNIIVDHVTLGQKAMVGHLAIVGPGTKLGEQTEIGVAAALGIRISIGDRSRVGPRASVNHGAQIGTDVEVGANSYIGIKAKIGNGVKLASATSVPDGAEIKNQEGLETLVREESKQLHDEKVKLQALYAERQNYQQRSG